MASGATHKAITFGASTLLLGAGWYVSPSLAVAASTGCLFGLWCQPDRDHVAGKSPIWFWYSRAFKHRGISHWPIIGTCTRLAYLSVPFLICWGWLEVGLWLSRATIPPWGLPIWGWQAVGCWLVGLMLSDILHWIADWKMWLSVKPKRRTHTSTMKRKRGKGRYESPPV